MSVRTKKNWPYCRVTVGGDPHTSKVIGIDFVFYELASTFLVNIDAPRLAVVDLTAYHCRVSIRFHLKPCNPVPVDITALKVALQRETKRQKSADWLLPKTDEIWKKKKKIGLITMPWSKVNTPTSLPWWIWLRLMIGLPWFFTQIPASALFEISLSS